MSSLPLELISHIVDILAIPEHPLQYGHDTDVLPALIQVCLVDRGFYTFAVPKLYSSIIVSDAESLLALAYTLTTAAPHLAQRVHSIYFHDFPESLSPAHANALASVLSTLSTFVRRVVFDRPLRDIWPQDDLHGIRPPLRRAFDSLCNVQEFASIQCELFLRHSDTEEALAITAEHHVCWPNYTHLERLVLYNPDVTPDFVLAIGRLPHLTHLVLVSFDYDGAEVIRDLLKIGSQLKRLLFVTRWEPRAAFHYNDGWQQMEAAARTARDGVEVVFVQWSLGLPPESGSTQDWVRDSLEDGTLWEVEGLSLSQKP